MEYILKNSRPNFNGRLVKIGAVAKPPFFYGKFSEDNSTFLPTDGTSYQFLLFLSKYFNFTWQIFSRNDWGMNKDLNGSYTGLIGSIISGEHDFAMSGLPTHLQIYNPLIRSTDFVQLGRITFMTLKAKPNGAPGTIFMPFDLSVWFFIIISLITLILMGKISEKVIKSKMDLQWLVFSSLLQRGLHRSPKGYGVNLLIQICWWSGLIIMASYGSAIISSLTNNKRVENIQSLDQFIEMVKDGQVLPIINRHGTYQYLFKQYKKYDRVYQILASHLLVASTYHEAIHRMIQARVQQKEMRYNKVFAIIGSYKYLDLWARSLGKQYFFYQNNINTAIFTDYSGMIFRYNSTLIEHFNRCIKFAREGGFFSKWFQRKYEWPERFDELKSMLEELDKDIEVSFSRNHPKSLTMDDINELFFIHLICLSFVIMIFICETIWKVADVSNQVSNLIKKIC